MLEIKKSPTKPSYPKTKTPNAFGPAYQEWLEARTESAKQDTGALGDLPEEEMDAVCNRLLDRRIAAERRLIYSRPDEGFQVIQKFEALEIMMSDRERDGRPSDNRHMLMLASVKADLYRCQINLEQEVDT